MIGQYGPGIAVNDSADDPVVPKKHISPSVVRLAAPVGQFFGPGVEVEGHPDNKVPVGEEIRLRAFYNAYYPDQGLTPFWTASVKAVGDGIAVKNDTTHFREGTSGQPLVHDPLLNHPAWPIMPNKVITLEVSLWAHRDAWQKLPL